LRTQQALRESNRRQQQLSELAEQLLVADASADAASAAFQMMAGELGLDAYFNYLVEPDGSLRLDSWSGIPAHVAHLISRLKAGEAVCGLVAQKRQPIHATHIQSSAEPRTELVRRFGLRAYYCHPLLLKGRLLGTLSFGTKSRDRFTEEELHFIQTVVRYVALADERLRAVSELRESEETLRSFYDSSPFLMGIAQPLEGDILHLYDNPATCRFFDHPPGSTRGKLASELGAPPEAIRQVESSPGIGSEFYFSLPCSEVGQEIE
jgi:GAF domain-containing protein